MHRAMVWLEGHAAGQPIAAAFLSAVIITSLLIAARLQDFGATSSLRQEILIGSFLFLFFAVQMHLATTNKYKQLWSRWRDWIRYNPLKAAIVLGLLGLAALASLALAIYSSL